MPTDVTASTVSDSKSERRGRDDAAPVDEMEGHFLDANERMGEALVAIGMALGLPRPAVGATWGAPEILARIAEIPAPVVSPTSAVRSVLAALSDRYGMEALRIDLEAAAVKGKKRARRRGEAHGYSDIADYLLALAAGPGDALGETCSDDFAGDELLLVRLPGRMSGRVTIGRSRLPAATILGELAAGTDHERITAAWPGATPEVLRVLDHLVDDLGLRAAPAGGEPPVVEVAVAALEASHRRLLDAQGLIGAEIGRVSLTLRRAHGAVVPDPEED